jgi:hypothetical protein
VDGTRKDVGVKNTAPRGVAAALDGLRRASTATVRDLARPVVSAHPSVQGPWDPSTTYEQFSLRIGGAAGSAQGAPGEQLK